MRGRETPNSKGDFDWMARGCGKGNEEMGVYGHDLLGRSGRKKEGKT